MKQTIIFALLAIVAEAAKTKAQIKDATNMKEPGAEPVAGQLGSVMSPAFLTALITVFFLYCVASFGFGQLMDIQVPPY